jgi:sugar (pentulose or hexulose) kinase
VRETKHTFNLANFMRSQLFTALGVLRIGMDILFEQEKVAIDSITGHGGFFKTAEVGQKMMASALHTPISVAENRWGGRSLGYRPAASFMVGKQNRSLADFLASEAFATAEKSTVEASEEEYRGIQCTSWNATNMGLPLKRPLYNI